MDIAVWIAIFMPLFFILWTEHDKKKKAKLRRIVNTAKAKRKKGLTVMNEAVKKFINKNCTIWLSDGGAVDGIVVSVEENWLTVENNGSQIINTDYISRISEIPVKVKKK